MHETSIAGLHDTYTSTLFLQSINGFLVPKAELVPNRDSDFPDMQLMNALRVEPQATPRKGIVRMRKYLETVVLYLVFTVGAVAGTSKISPDLQSVDPSSNVRVIVQYNQAPPASSMTLAALLQGVVSDVLSLVNAVAYTVPASGLASLANDPTVVSISPDRTVAGQLDDSAAAVNAGAAWRSSLTGIGVGVAVIDSGIDISPNLSALGILPRVVYTQDFTGGNGADQYGHGTHVAGIIDRMDSAPNV